jgi:hypothetical protein
MFEDMRIDIKELRVRHAHDVLGVFEPVSCLLFLNVTDAEFDAAIADPADPATAPLTETLAHETCHYFQTFCTGYLYRQYAQLRKVYASALDARVERRVWPLIRRFYVYRLRPWLLFWWSPSTRRFLMVTGAVKQGQEDLRYFEERSAEYGERTIAGAAMPGLHAALESVRAESQRRGSSGLSAQDVFEGAAFVMGKLYAHGEQAEDEIRAALSNPESPYERLMHFSLPYAPERRVWFPLLMASALALRYDRPGEAYLPILNTLLASTPGDERARAKVLASSLPVIPAAGAPPLGTGSEVRRALKEKRKTGYYASALQKMANGAWPVDELDLLTDPNAVEAIPLGGPTFGIVTRDGERAAPGTRDLYVRMLFGSELLPNGPSVASFRKDFLSKLREVRPFIRDGLFDGLLPPSPPS